MATKKGKTNLKRTSMVSTKCRQQNEDVGNKKETMTIEMCRVCDASGAARHYGSVCCSGCKGFFRRSVRFQKIYRCPYEAKCAISKLYRNCCRACRFQKCISIGLDPNLVHGDWGQTGGNANSITPKGATPKVNSDAINVPSSTISSPSSESLPNPLSEITTTSPFSNSGSSSSDSELPMPIKLIEANVLVQQNKILNSEDSMLALGYNNRLKMCIPPTKGAINNCMALSEYFIAVERLCDLFVDSSTNSMTNPTGGSLAHPKDWLPNGNLEVPVGMAMKQPGKVSPRFPMNWTPNFVICKTMLQRVYCRIMVHYFDWASHVPELAEFNEEDRVKYFFERIDNTNNWMGILFLNIF